MTKMLLKYYIYVVLYQISANATFDDCERANAVTCNENKKRLAQWEKQ